MTTGERLAAELRRAWCGEPWHGPSVAAVLGRLDARRAAHARWRGSHSPWELVRHLTTWVDVPRRRLDDAAYEPTVDADFPVPATGDDAQWQRDVTALGAAIEALAVRVSAMSDAALDVPVGVRGYTVTRMVDGVVQHLAYHAGQAALLARPKEEVANLLAPAPLFPLGAVAMAEIGNRYMVGAHFDPPRALGWGLIMLGAALAYWAHEHFVARRTPAAPWRAPRSIVRAGPYRFTRNPMYLGFLIIQAGIGCVRLNPLYLILLLPTWAFIHWGVVLREEPFLLRTFGASYQQLLDSTRRWF